MRWDGLTCLGSDAGWEGCWLRWRHRRAGRIAGKGDRVDHKRGRERVQKGSLANEWWPFPFCLLPSPPVCSFIHVHPQSIRSLFIHTRDSTAQAAFDPDLPILLSPHPGSRSYLALNFTCPGPHPAIDQGLIGMIAGLVGPIWTLLNHSKTSDPIGWDGP